MPRRDPPNRFGEPADPWHAFLPFAVAAVVLISLGLYVLVNVLTIKAGSSAKADRLEKSGVAVEALLTNYHRGRRQSSTVWLQYEYGGVIHRVKVDCDEPPLCDPDRSRTMRILVDPAEPRELVTDLGVTDDSTRYLDSWAFVPWGLMFLAIGGLSTFLSWVFYRQSRTGSRPGT
ncbi:hypothetical protein [Actinoplanes sp. GCM10030250]|uniref:hypothetical protein n=1 Tax=Actinoplanes sp. GCM10030250 TaxID=3273376 RepID=UPI0036097C69